MHRFIAIPCSRAADREYLADCAAFQSCFGTPPIVPCLALDADANSAIDLSDFAAFVGAMNEP